MNVELPAVASSTPRTMNAHLAALFVLAAIGSRAPCQQVWVVAPAPGPGVSFTDIQPAIDAASDGDTVLVRAAMQA